MSATTELQLPGAQSQHSNGKHQQRRPRKKQARGRQARVAAAPTPKSAAAQPLPQHRLARTVTQPPKGVSAQTSAFIAFKADFIQSLLAASTAPTEQQCAAWVAMFQADLNGACLSIAKA